MQDTQQQRTYLAYTHLRALLPGGEAKVSAGVQELLESGVSIERLRALYPLDRAELAEGFITAFRRPDALQAYLEQIVYAYNNQNFEVNLPAADAQAEDWGWDLAQELEDDLAALPKAFLVRSLPAGWSQVMPRYYFQYAATDLLRALAALENWGAYERELRLWSQWVEQPYATLHNDALTLLEGWRVGVGNVFANLASSGKI